MKILRSSLLAALAGILLAAGAVRAQSPVVGIQVSTAIEFTVATLPASTISGQIYLVTDANPDCGTGGSPGHYAWCRYNGATYDTIGGTGSGTVTVVGSGSLTNTAFVTGGGTTTLQTPSSTSTLDTSGNAVFAGTLKMSAAFSTVSDGSPIAWNLGSVSFANGIVTLNHLTATRALNVTNLVIGGNYVLEVKQDGTGGASLTYGTGCTWLFLGGNKTNTTTASAVDVLAFTYDGTNCLATLGLDYK